MKKKNFIIHIAISLILSSTFSFAQTYNRSFKFNYGIFLYSDLNSQSIAKILDPPFSLGLQYQSNFNKAFSNSLGINVYKWSDGDRKNESISGQDILFIRNNARLFNRLKPQIGFGLGFEERKITNLNQKSFEQYLFVPINIGFQTDITEKLALGIFGEIRYGFQFSKFNFNNGQILPNNTAGLSLAYSFGRVKENNNYQPINWGVEQNDLITLENLKVYRDTNQNKQKFGLSANSNPNDLRLENLDSLNYKREKISSINLINSKNAENIVLKDSSNLKNQIVGQKSIAKKGLLIPNNFKLSDFKDSTSVSYPDEKLVTVAQEINEDSTVSRVDTVFIIKEKYSSVTNQPKEIPNSNESQITSKANPKNTTNYNDIEKVENLNANLLNAQLAQMISMQKETNRLLQNQQAGKIAFPNPVTSRIDSLNEKIAMMERRMNIMDSLLHVNKTLIIKQDSQTLKYSQSLPKNKELEKEVDEQKVNSFNEPIKSEFSNIKAIITYPINQTEITDLQRTLILNELIKGYNNNSKNSIVLEAFTDANGSSMYNKQISQVRMNKLIDFLTSYGINKKDIKTINHGDDNAINEINKEERKIIIRFIE